MGKDSPSRTIAIEGSSSLRVFAHIIIDSFDFDFDHAYGFYDNLKNWTRAKECYEYFVDMEDSFGAADNAQSVINNTIKTAFASRDKMLFLFDYGDEWLFTVKLVKKTDPAKGMNYPAIIESIGEAPPQYQ